MTTLKGIKGDQIRYLDEDPVVQGIAGGTWASGGNINNSRGEGTGAGTLTAGIIMGGRLAPPAGATRVAYTETYDGTSWTEVADLNEGKRDLSAATQGTTTASLVFGGDLNSGTPTFVANTESWNGSAWTEVNNLTITKENGAGAGTQTAALSFGGDTDPEPTYTNNVQSWNGTSWTDTTSMNTTRNQLGGTGTQTDALAYAGYTGTAYTNVTEVWNGSTWTEVSDLNTTRGQLGSAGLYNAAMALGGYTGTAITGNVEIYDGTSWTEVADMATSVSNASGGGSTSAAFKAAGFTGPTASTANSEEWTTAPTNSLALQEGMMWFNSTSQTLKGYGAAAGIPAGTWASGGNLPTTIYQNASSGASVTSALNFGGANATPSPTSQIALTQTYDGTAWTEVNDLTTGRRLLQGSGTQTSSLAYGGFTTPTSYLANTESWDGTSWTEVNDLNNAAGEGQGFGFSGTSAVMAGANPSGRSPSAEQWDG